MLLVGGARVPRFTPCAAQGIGALGTDENPALSTWRRGVRGVEAWVHWPPFVVCFRRSTNLLVQVFQANKSVVLHVASSFHVCAVSQPTRPRVARGARARANAQRRTAHTEALVVFQSVTVLHRNTSKHSSPSTPEECAEPLLPNAVYTTVSILVIVLVFAGWAPCYPNLSTLLLLMGRRVLSKACGAWNGLCNQATRVV